MTRLHRFSQGGMTYKLYITRLGLLFRLILARENTSDADNQRLNKIKNKKLNTFKK